MIDEIVKVHDKSQFEIKFNYQPEEGNKRTRHSAEIYIFSPKNLGVNKNTYSKIKFYGDVKSHIRLKTPSILLKNIYGNNSPIALLENSIQKLVLEQNQKNISDFEYRIKMFCSVLKSSLREEILFIEKNQNSKDFDKNISYFLNELKELSKEFRKLSKKIKVASIPEKFINLYNFADEYLSIISNESRHELFEIIKKNEIKKSDDLIDELLEQAKNEINHRKANGYPSIPSEENDNEELIFRRSALKKLMGQVLFLNNRTKPEGTLVEQIFFGISAGIAMAFATAIAFMSRTKFGEYSLFFFLLLVIAYIFKDRMKDILKNHFANLVRKYFADKKTRIYTGLEQKIGVIRETFSFIEEDELPKEIKTLRNRAFFSEVHEGGYGEDVLLYRKNITLYSDRFKQIFPDFKIDGINDITRLNIFRFLRNMDNPKENIFIPKKNSYSVVEGSRVYHVNIVIKNTVSEGHNSFSRIRLILDKNGIKRIEEVKIQ